MNEKQAKVHSALASFTFTPGFEFAPRMVELGIDNREIHSILVELQEMGLAELANGRGWRAIPGPNTVISKDDAALYGEWQIAVSERLTILGYPEWLLQKAISAGMFDEDEEATDA